MERPGYICAFHSFLGDIVIRADDDAADHGFDYFGLARREAHAAVFAKFLLQTFHRVFRAGLSQGFPDVGRLSAELFGSVATFVSFVFIFVCLYPILTTCRT